MKLKNFTILALATLMGLAPIVAVEAGRWDDGFSRTSWSATGMLVSDGRMVCSGFAHRPAPGGVEFVTARHCITGTLDLMVTFSPSAVGPFYRVRAGSVRKSETDDVAAMVILADPENFVRVVPLADERKLELGDTVVNVAYPANTGKTRFLGIFIAPRFRNINDALRYYGWERAMPIDVPAAGGSSGSPVFDYGQKGVIGIVVGHFDGIEIAIPGTVIQEFLDSLEA